MNSTLCIRRNGLLLVLAMSIAAALCAAGPLDKGLLDPAWFGEDIEFRTSGRLDYFWVKPGLSLQGARIQIAEWPDPLFLGPQADINSKDSARAFELASSMPTWIRGALSS
ncbi:MAG TPA: hypothetical protein VMW27_28015, partial [Thermoanaerobaculia bacterium]|nr:hypothetical protein [Thermoanaerobaculia bacterium]